MDDRILERIGDNIRQIRIARKLSQEELAELSELHRTYLSGIERGIRNPSILILVGVARALGVSVIDLLAEDVRPVVDKIRGKRR